MNPILIFLISLLIPASKPCLSFVALAKEDLTTNTAIQCLQSLPALENKIKFANFFLRSPLVSDLLSLIPDIKPFLPHLDILLGQKKPVTYLVLLQNDREMRANGGFFGSYAVITFGPCQLPADSCPLTADLRFQDIYVPDGALVGHVDPPAPIKTAFKQGWFRLRDSDWEPDFPTAAKTIRWFFEKGGEINPDFLITLNLTTIEKIMAVVGEVDIPEFNFKLNSDNLYTLLQNQAEINFFPGSTQKQNVLTAAGSALIKKLSLLSAKGGSASGGEFAQYVQLVQILLNQLNHTNLLVNSTNSDIQEIILAKKWGGQLSAASCQQSGCLADSVLLVETNLGANKANCCVDRSTKHTITRSAPNEAFGEVGSITHLIQLTFTTTSPLENPLPPRFYGGNYVSYLRYYLPENARNIRLTAQPTLPKTLSQYPAPFDGINQKTFDYKISNFKCAMTNEPCQMKQVGFFHTTAAGTKSAVQLSYDLPLDSQFSIVNYQLNLLKQNGLESSPSEINLFGHPYSNNLDSSFTITSPI